jgi:hypothetical protein
MDLLGLNVTNKPSCRGCAFERSRAEQKTSEYGCDMRLFAGGLDGKSESGLPAYVIGGKQMSSLFNCVSPTTNPAVTRSLLRGQTDARRQARSSASATPPSVTVSICDGPSVNAELRPWESAPLARLRQV